MFSFIFAIIYFIIASILIVVSFIVETQIDGTYAFFAMSLVVIIFTLIFSIVFYWTIGYENVLIILILNTLLMIIFILSFTLYIIKPSNFTFSIILTSGLVCMLILYLTLLRVNDKTSSCYNAYDELLENRIN